jgi:hypothetical protein
MPSAAIIEAPRVALAAPVARALECYRVIAGHLGALDRVDVGNEWFCNGVPPTGRSNCGTCGDGRAGALDTSGRSRGSRSRRATLHVLLRPRQKVMNWDLEQNKVRVEVRAQVPPHRGHLQRYSDVVMLPPMATHAPPKKLKESQAARLALTAGLCISL